MRWPSRSASRSRRASRSLVEIRSSAARAARRFSSIRASITGRTWTRRRSRTTATSLFVVLGPRPYDRRKAARSRGPRRSSARTYRRILGGGPHDARAEEVVPILERDREAPRELLEGAPRFRRGPGCDGPRGRRAGVQPGGLCLAHPHVVGLREADHALEIDVETLSIAQDHVDLGEFREELHPDGGRETRRSLDRPLREGPDPKRVQDGLGGAVSRLARPEDDRRAVRIPAAVERRVRGPCAEVPPAAHVLIHDVVQEQGVQVVPLDPRGRPLEIPGRRLARQEFEAGEGEGVSIPLARREEARVLPHRPRRRIAAGGMLAGVLVPEGSDVRVRRRPVRGEERLELPLG